MLYGGTALALRLVHRPSIDFFAHDHLDHRELMFGGATLVFGTPEVTTLIENSSAHYGLATFMIALPSIQ